MDNVIIIRCDERTYVRTNEQMSERTEVNEMKSYCANRKFDVRFPAFNVHRESTLEQLQMMQLHLHASIESAFKLTLLTIPIR